MTTLPNTEDVLERCRAAGFALSGVAPALPSPRADQQDAWFAEGRHGSMAWMEEHTGIRRDVRELLPGAAAVICVADRYTRGEPDVPVPGQGRIARYARGSDYHVVMKRRLHSICDALQELAPGHQFRACVDTVPVHERELAEAAGIGAIGKNTLLIAPTTGSWILLGEIVTTLPLEPTRPPDAPPTDPCGSCTRCIDACPTGAIEPWSIDASRCISELTIERRGAIDPSLHEAMGDWIFGCDICQEVCPHNEPTTRRDATPVHESYARPPTDGVPGRNEHGDAFELETVLGWNVADRQDAFTRSAMKRAKLDMMRRNAVIAAANALGGVEAGRLRERTEAIAGDDTEVALVRDTAIEVLS